MSRSDGGIRYSITSSARASSDGGTVMPSALAVFRIHGQVNLLRLLDGKVLGPDATQDVVDDLTEMPVVR
jgi:hypothetical protein